MRSAGNKRVSPAEQKDAGPRTEQATALRQLQVLLDEENQVNPYLPTCTPNLSELELRGAGNSATDAQLSHQPEGGGGRNGDVSGGRESDGILHLQQSAPTQQNVKNWTWVLVMTSFAAVFGSSFPNGYNTGVLNSPRQIILDFCNSTHLAKHGEWLTEYKLTLLWSFVVAAYLLGAMPGAICAGWVAERIGRKKALMANHFFSFLGGLLLAFSNTANSVEMLILGRIVIGFQCGFGMVVCPMYLTESSNVRVRGSIGVLHQFFVTIGILTSQILGLQQLLGNESRWSYLLAFNLVPAIVALIILPFCPESPKFLYFHTKVNAEDAARRALQRLRGRTDVDSDLEEMRLERKELMSEPRWSMLHLLRSRRLRRPFALVVAINAAQQLTGINAIFFYSTGIFLDAGIPKDMAPYMTMIAGAINVSMTFAAIPLVENLGRRTLLLWGMAGMIFTTFFVTISLTLEDPLTYDIDWMAYISLVMFFLFVVFYSIGLGCIPQFFGGEVFKQGPRPAAMSIACMVNWFGNFLVAMCFPIIQAALQYFTFIIFLAITIFFFVVTLLYLPETKNKTVEENYRAFGIQPATAATDEEEVALQGDTKSTVM